MTRDRSTWTAPMRSASTLEWAFARIEIGDCWVWRGPLDPYGYGRAKRARTDKYRRAHRLIYELLVGAIPDGLTVDHLCRVRACVNPDHMELVTHVENNRRGFSVSAQAARQARCLRGHEFTPENTYRPRGAPGTRVCRACQRSRRSERYQAERGATAA